MISYIKSRTSYITHFPLELALEIVNEPGARAPHAQFPQSFPDLPKPSNYKIGSCIAECGSNFGELLLFDRLLSKAATKEEKQAFLAALLDSFGMSV